MTDNEWVLVPRGVTPEMESVYANETGAYQSAQALHDAMLAAAPSPPADAGRGGLVGDLLTDLRAAATMQRPLTHGEVDDIGRRINDALTAKAAHPAPDPLPPELEGTLSPMAEMAEALRRKAEIERERYEDRRQSGEWGPAPDAGTQADFCPSCDGSGWDGESRTDLCPACNGGREPEPRKAAAPAQGVGEAVAWIVGRQMPGGNVGKYLEWGRGRVPYSCGDAAVPLYTAPPAPHGDGPDATLLKFYGVDGYPALVGALEAHVLQLIDTHKRNVKLWEDTFPPTLLPKWIREKEQKALVLAGKWQDEAAESWGETAEHATLQRCADELRAAIAAQAWNGGGA